MARISAETRQGKLDELEFNMRKCFMSAGTIEACRENATAQTIDFLCDLFRGEREKREKSRVASLVKAAGFPTIKNIDDYCTSEIRLPSSLDSVEADYNGESIGRISEVNRKRQLDLPY